MGEVTVPGSKEFIIIHSSCTEHFIEQYKLKSAMI